MEHELKEIACFTSRPQLIPLPEGGSKSVSVPLDIPYYRWYCSCGAIGGKSYTRQEANFTFKQHRSGSPPPR